MLVIKTAKEHYMITDMDYVSYSTENIQELLHLFSFVDNKFCQCTLNSFPKT